VLHRGMDRHGGVRARHAMKKALLAVVFFAYASPARRTLR